MSLTREQVEHIAEHTKQALEHLSDLESIDEWVTHDADQRQQLATVARERDAYYISMNEAHAEAMRDKEALATARLDVWQEAIFFVDHRSNDEDLIQALREQAQKEA